MQEKQAKGLQCHIKDSKFNKKIQDAQKFKEASRCKQDEKLSNR